MFTISLLLRTRVYRSYNRERSKPILGSTLDEEKLKWMMHRWDDRWWEDDAVEIYEKLRKDMDETMAFLEHCTKKDLDVLDSIIIDLLDDFDDHGDGEYIAFLERLADSHSDEGLKDLLNDIKTSLYEYY